MRVLLLALLALVPWPEDQPQTNHPPQPAPQVPLEQPGQAALWPSGLYVEVLEGQALGLFGGQPSRLMTGSAARPIAESSRLELSARARVRLVLPGSFQLQLKGPAILELHAPGSPGASLVVKLLEHGRVDLECRREGPALTLPGGQVLFPRRGVLRLEAGSPGHSHLEVRGGEPVELDLGGRYSFELPVGFTRRLPERLDPAPASYRGRDC